MNFADRIRSYRRDKGLSQSEFADLLDISRHYVGEIENGREPSSRLLREIEHLISADSQTSQRRKSSSAALGDRTKDYEEGSSEQRGIMKMNEGGSDYYHRSLILSAEAEYQLEAIARATGIPRDGVVMALISAAAAEIEGSGKLQFPLRFSTDSKDAPRI